MTVLGGGGSLGRGGSGICKGIETGGGRIEGKGGGGGSRRLAVARSEAWGRGGVGGAWPSPSSNLKAMLIGGCFLIQSVPPEGLLGGNLGGSGGGVVSLCNVPTLTSLLIFSTNGTGRSFFPINAGGSDRTPFTEQIVFSDVLVFLRAGNEGAVLVRLTGREGGAPRLEGESSRFSPREVIIEGGTLGSVTVSSPRNLFGGIHGALRLVGLQETSLESIGDLGGTRRGVRGGLHF